MKRKQSPLLDTTKRLAAVTAGVCQRLHRLRKKCHHKRIPTARLQLMTHFRLSRSRGPVTQWRHASQTCKRRCRTHRLAADGTILNTSATTRRKRGRAARRPTGPPRHRPGPQQGTTLCPQSHCQAVFGGVRRARGEGEEDGGNRGTTGARGGRGGWG